MDADREIEIPEQWRRLVPAELRGVLLVIGPPDTGKSTFARYLYSQQSTLTPGKVAILDGDPGQSQLGLPATMTVSLDPKTPGGNMDRRWFVGAVTPRGHMLPLLVGAARLVEAAREDGANTIIYDTCGLVTPTQGGLALKHAKITLLRPQMVFAFQRQDELEQLLVPLERSGATRVVRLTPAVAVLKRDPTARRLYREAQFAGYFESSHRYSLDWKRLAIVPVPNFSLERLVALEDKHAFTLGLGVIQDIDRPSHRIRILTPLASLAAVRTVQLGDLLLDPLSGEHSSLTG